jgi:uracil-DNA glycosylase
MGTQGVLLLNSSLTVRYQKKESHMKIWKPFTDKLIELISQFNPNPVVFMLWGNYAKSKRN